MADLTGMMQAAAGVSSAPSDGLIGVQGEQGFGVGTYPDTLPSGFAGVSGYDDPTSSDYGNYIYNSESVMVFIPRFYYRIGSTSSPRYATYGNNAIDIAGIDTYADESAANADGFAMHRAFIDGGATKHGFFIDKYLCSKSSDGVSYGRSVALGVPISLTTNTNYTRSQGMTGCTGILADAVVLARARGSGTFNCASIFMYSALALLSLAHAQASSSTTNCAWYDATNNFPKGCNNNALGDTNDGTLSFTTAGDAGSANKPLTGSGSTFAKTTHNGQNSGVADLNGAMWEAALGITYWGSTATSTTDVTSTTNAYVLKESVALSSLTGGWNGTNAAWQDSTNITTYYDDVSSFYWWTATTTYFGNSTNKVFSEATSGTNWLKTACGVAVDSNGMSATGTSLFGNDVNYATRTHNMFPACGGHWAAAAEAGVFSRLWNFYRSFDSAIFGFRAGAYGS